MTIISVESEQPFPLAPLNSENLWDRKRGRSKILTKTSEKEVLKQQIIENRKELSRKFFLESNHEVLYEDWSLGDYVVINF